VRWEPDAGLEDAGVDPGRPVFDPGPVDPGPDFHPDFGGNDPGKDPGDAAGDTADVHADGAIDAFDPGAVDPGPIDPGPELPSGPGTCVDAYRCLQDSACVDDCPACRALIKPAEQLKFDALTSCVSEYCATYGATDVFRIDQCVQARCATLIFGATQCDVPDTGTATCRATLSCVQGCKGARACQVDCENGVSTGARAAFLTLAACLETCADAGQGCAGDLNGTLQSGTLDTNGQSACTDEASNC
jgi:hypothetical protein